MLNWIRNLTGSTEAQHSPTTQQSTSDRSAEMGSQHESPEEPQSSTTQPMVSDGGTNTRPASQKPITQASPDGVQTEAETVERAQTDPEKVVIDRQRLEKLQGSTQEPFSATDRASQNTTEINGVTTAEADTMAKTSSKPSGLSPTTKETAASPGQTSVLKETSDRLVASALIDSSWVSDHLEEFKSDDPEFRLIEVDRKSERYEAGHIPGAIGINWQEEVGSDLDQGLVDEEAFEAVMEKYGITEDTTLVFYGDEGNWHAAHAFWVCRYFGHEDVCMMSGGRRHWRREGYEMTTTKPQVSETTYSAGETNEKIKRYATRTLPTN